MKKPFYITSAIPYVNASPHLGHALEFVQTDVIARFNELLGKKVIALTGSDENALKNVQSAEKENTSPKDFVDKNSEKFLNLIKKLNARFDIFQRTTDKKHFKSSQELWIKCQKDIYKKNYEGLYCSGCEAFYEKDELINNECPEHPGKKLELVKEENYFFKLSKYQNRIIKIIKEEKIKIYPEFRKKEVLEFLKKPLKDISISRSNKRAKNWGIPVPGDPQQKIYVWFDALNVYRSGIKETIWPADLHVIGKGIIRFHAVYWPAFLLSANLSLPKAIFVHGYFTVNGKKMSKTIGNIIDPFEIIEKYGIDPLRYYILRENSPFDDGDFSYSRLDEIYKSDLANELGNLVTRLTNMGEKDELVIKNSVKFKFDIEIVKKFKNFQFNLILEDIWKNIKNINKSIDNFAPWKKKKNQRKKFLLDQLLELKKIAFHLKPFMPDTSEKIFKSINGRIKKIPPIFPKIK